MEKIEDLNLNELRAELSLSSSAFPGPIVYLKFMAHQTVSLNLVLSYHDHKCDIL